MWITRFPIRRLYTDWLQKVDTSAELGAQDITPASQVLPPSRKQSFLLFDVQVSAETFKHHAGGDLGEVFGLDFVEASAVDAAFRNQFAGLNPYFAGPHAQVIAAARPASVSDTENNPLHVWRP